MDELRLARRLHRGARAAARAQLRAEVARARAVRRREKARQALPRRLLVSLGAGAASVPLDGPLEVLTGGVCVYAAVFALRSFSVLHAAARVPVPAQQQQPSPPQPPLPPWGSAAFGHVMRLERVREELRRLLPLVAPVGRPAAEEAWAAAAEADLALRWQAARVAAVEPHGAVPGELLQALEDGVGCQERLVAVVADLVAASADPMATWRLQEATDRLHGLAQGLRELR